jgi:hypothetical protein
MRKVLSLGALAAAVAALFSASAVGSVGPPGGTIYAFDHAFQTVGTPTSLPDTGRFDTLYQFPDCASCAAVSDGAPGHPGYNGGRWHVVLAYGITSQLTNADAVVAAASVLVATDTRFVCPLIR